MTVFALLDFEPIIQAGDLLRLDALKSTVTPDETISKVEIDPLGRNEFIDITTDKFLDFVYESTVDKTVTPVLKVTGSTSGAVEKRFSIRVLTEATDALFSNDEQLRTIEPEIRRYLPKGKSTFKNIHRRAQQLVLDDLDRRGLTSEDGSALVKEDFISNQDVSEWSAFKALTIIYGGISNEVDDIFDKKANKYSGMAAGKGNRVAIRLDKNRDGTVDEHEKLDSNVIDVVRR